MVKFYESATDDLILYSRQLGWLHAKPSVKLSKGAKTVSGDQPTRADKLKAKNEPLPLPEVLAEYLVLVWARCGLSTPSGMGPLPLTPSDVISWASGTSETLTPWEFETILSMSRAYVSSLSTSSAPETPAPFTQPDRLDRVTVQRKVHNLFEAMAQKGKK